MNEIINLDHKGNISGAVDAELVEHANEIRRLGKSAVGDIIEIGKHLAAAKKLAGHGNWLPWLAREFGWASESTALRFMRAAELSKSVSLTDLNIDLAAIHLLAAPSTPAGVVEDVVALDKKITVKDVTKAKAAHKRNCAPALPKPQTKLKSVKPSPPADPIDDVARGIVTQCADGKWRSLPKIATTVRYAEDAVRKALKSLGETGVAQRKNGDGEHEYWIAGKGDAGWRHALAARDGRIAQSQGAGRRA